MSIADTIDRMVGAVGGKTQGDLGAALGISQASISDAKRKGKIPPEWIVRLSTERGLNPSWLLTGSGPMKISSGVEQVHDEVAEKESFSMAEMLAATARVLESKTVYRSALASNIRAFDKAVLNEGRLMKIEEELVEMKGMLQQVLQQQREEHPLPGEGNKKREAG